MNPKLVGARKLEPQKSSSSLRNEVLLSQNIIYNSIFGEKKIQLELFSEHQKTMILRNCFCRDRMIRKPYSLQPKIWLGTFHIAQSSFLLDA